ncbi:unnamed protein product [Caenorhabditis angaria]|uniref:F-box domain-containing protein n=1 Tax=Caenorhabditis angaria TaxID=860376 RepID=A0A9P1MUK5_9PELO|nr:unnamed protein product [Caenorhabditis angaria]
MTCWDDMPFEMKLEVFKYLNKNDRWKFAKCSFTCFQEVVGQEKYIESLDVEGKITIFIIKIDQSFVITFKQIDYDLMEEVFEKLDVLRINLIFNNNQFIKLTQHLKSIECDARNIDPSILAQIVLESMRSHVRLELSLRNVDVEILNSLKLVPRFSIYRSISYN